MENINRWRLIILTLAVTLIGLAPYEDGSKREIIFFASGFMYTLVLYLSLHVKPSLLKLIIALLILGTTSIYVFYVVLIVNCLPEEVARQLIYVPPSVTGALVTISVLHFIWKLRFYARAVGILLTCILFASLASAQILKILEELPRYDDIAYSINNSLWWLAFSTGILIEKCLFKRIRK